MLALGSAECEGAIVTILFRYLPIFDYFSFIQNDELAPLVHFLFDLQVI